MMKDTSDEIMTLQNEIWLSKPESERWRLGIEMIEDGRNIIKASIKKQYPTISERELKIQIFLRFYQNDFSTEELQKITTSF